MHLNDIADEVLDWAKAKGWEDQDRYPRTFGDECALITSEVSEALEAYREYGLNRYTDQGGALSGDEVYPQGAKPEGVASELADVMIRTLHYMKSHGFDPELEISAKMDYNGLRSHRHGNKNL